VPVRVKSDSIMGLCFARANWIDTPGDGVLSGGRSLGSVAALPLFPSASAGQRRMQLQYLRHVETMTL
jgi:hypothetical protein